LLGERRGAAVRRRPQDVGTHVGGRDVVADAAEDRHVVPLLGARHLVRLPAHRHRLVEQFEQVRAAPGDDVVHGDRAGDPGHTAGLALAEEEQPRDIGGVAVEAQRRILRDNAAALYGIS
jgi:hypothetical protein